MRIALHTQANNARSQPRHESLRKVFNTRFLTLCTVLRNSGTPGYNW